MIDVKIISVGNLKESYLRDACAEYEKRLGAFCRIETKELKEARLSENPSEGEIRSALQDEGRRILSAIPAGAYKVAMAVEGQQFSSDQLAKVVGAQIDAGKSLCFIVGSSYGLSDEVKKSADLKLSMSKLTFPHRLFRVMLLETVYRSFTIMKGTKYHK